MSCEILNTLYLRSNGDIPCHDDAGETVLLGRVDAGDPAWDIMTVFGNANYERVRSAFAQGGTPWGETCLRCALLREHEVLSDGLSKKRIRTFQVEPSLACQLCCPCCSQPNQIRVRPKPFILPLVTFATILDSLRRNHFQIEEIEYCGQGEPLMHPSFPSLVETARDHFPTARGRLITNGNFDYWKATRNVGLDEIFVSCDGFFPESYVKYRVGGNVRMPLRFMREAPHETQGKRQVVIWKYILFEFNDSDKEIRAAQEAAQELGVDLLMFVFTHSRYKSERYRAANAADFPIFYPNVTTSATPIHQRQLRTAVAVEIKSFETSDAMGVLDEVAVLGNGKLWIRGWVLSGRSLKGIEVELDDRPVGRARLGLPRPDVYWTHPEYANRYGGFDFTGGARATAGLHRIGVRLLPEGSEPIYFVRAFRFPAELPNSLFPIWE